MFRVWKCQASSLTSSETRTLSKRQCHPHNDQRLPTRILIHLTLNNTPSWWGLATPVTCLRHQGQTSRSRSLAHRGSTCFATLRLCWRQVASAQCHIGIHTVHRALFAAGLLSTALTEDVQAASRPTTLTLSPAVRSVTELYRLETWCVTSTTSALAEQ